MRKITQYYLLSFGLISLLSCQSFGQTGTTTATELNKFADIVRPDKVTLGIMVTGVEYATGWTPLRGYFYPRSEQKLLIVHYVVKNRNSRDTRVGEFSTTITAIGDNKAEYKQSNRKELRLAGTTENFDASLKPGQSQALYTAVVVDGDAKIESLRIDPQTVGATSTSIQLGVANKVADLPSYITDNGDYKNDFDGKFKQTYRLSTADVSVQSFTTIGGKLPAMPTNNELSWGIVYVNVRNVHAEKKRVFYDTFKPTTALTNTGRIVKPRHFTSTDLQDRIDKNIEAYESVQGAIAFPLEDGESLKEVYLRERPNRAADGEETSIAIHYTLQSDQNPLDKFLNNTIAQQISGVNRRPAFEGESAPPGVYDPLRSWADFFVDNGSIPTDALNGTGPKDLTGATLVPFFSPPPVIVNRPEDKNPPANPPADPKPTPTPPNINMAIRVKELSVWGNEEATGDEPWVAIIAFRGIPGKPETANSFFIPSTQCKTVGSGMKDKQKVQLSTQLGLREFRDIKPFEMIGLYVISAEVDGGSASDRDSSALRMADKLFNEWKAFLGKSNPYPLNVYSNENVRRQAVRLNMAYNQFIRPTQFSSEFSAPGTVDNDDYVKSSGAIWMYLPGLSDSQAMAISKVPSVDGGNYVGPGSGYIPQGTWNIEHYRNDPYAWYRFQTQLYKLN
jgi:hypothetical protein